MPRPIIKHTLAVIGKPLAQSYSKTYWNEIFKKKQMSSFFYDAKELDSIEEFPELIASNPTLCGLNVTIPYKESVIKYLDHVDAAAAEMGAVNTIKVERTGDKTILIGYNTDWCGFKNSLEPMLKPHHKKALILGTGGASKAIVYALKQLGIEYKMVSRGKEGCLSYSDLTEDVMNEYKILINTTPVGSFPATDRCPDIPYQYITADHVVVDIIYNPIRTLFLQQAEVKGASIKNGWEMFEGQAKEAWNLLIKDRF